MDAQLRELTLEITRECMNRCLYCSSLAVERSCTPPIAHTDFAKIIREAMGLGLHSLAISGGEPFLHPEMDQVLGTCSRLEVPLVLVYTSGVARDGRGEAVPLTDASLAAVRRSGARLVFNVEALGEETHDRIVGASGRLSLTLDTLRRAVVMGIHVECHMVPNGLNAGTIADTARGLIAMGVRRVSFLRLVPQGYAAGNRELVVCDRQAEAILQQQFRALLRDPEADRAYRFGVPFSGHCGEPKRCQAGISKLIMRWDGTFFPCEAFKECGRDEFSLGRAAETTLAVALARVRSCAQLRTLKSQTIDVDTCPAQCLY